LTIVYEIAVTAADKYAGTVRSWFDAGPRRTWPELPGLRSLDAYSPVSGGKDPHVDDGLGPCLLCILAFVDEDALRAAIAGATFKRGLAGLPSAVIATADAMHRRCYGADGEIDGHELVAAFSYVVRYHRPAEDERAFVAHYVASHPALLAALPGIRSVLCYFPLAWSDPNGLPSAQYMLGNEVAFDSIADFNAAMQSPVRHELRAHYRNFPSFSGRNTHYPMLRERLFASTG
jgi:uncharacterized protein (TIGR02118 family)